MAVGDVFKKRRNLVQQQSSPLPTGAPQYSYRPQYGGWMQDNPVFNEPPNLKGMSESQMAGPLQEYLAQTGFLPNMVYRQNPMGDGTAATPQPQTSGRTNAFKVGPTGQSNNLRVNAVNPDVESARRLAPMLAQDAARQQNTPANGMTAYEANPMRYRPGDPAMQARQQDNAQRMTAGRPADRTRGEGDRFAGSAGRINAEYDKVQAGHGIFSNGRFIDFTPTGTPESARAAQLAGKTAREALRNRENPAANQDEQDRRNNADVARREREARHNQFKDANNGMNYRQYDRMQSQNALTMKAVDEGRLSPEAANLRMQTRADKALRRAGNPMLMGTDESRRLFPNVLGNNGAANQAGPNPMFGQAGGRTIEAQQAAATRIQERETTSPNVAGLGVEPGTGLAGLNQVLSGRLQEDPNAEFSDESLREFQAHAKDYDSLATDANNPFGFGTGEYGPDAGVESQQAALWRELAGLPDNARARQEWLRKFKGVKAAPSPDMLDPANQQPSPFQSPEKPMYRGGNPMYTPRLPIRTGA